MTLYVVERELLIDSIEMIWEKSLVGVFSSREKAEYAIKELGGSHYSDSLEIVEKELDCFES